ILVQVQGRALPSEDAFASACRVVTGTYPTNVKASVNGRPPFWSRPGPLTETVPAVGLAQEITAVLGGAAGPVALDLAIATDAPGVLQAAFDPEADADLERAAPARWGGEPTTDLAVSALEAQAVTVPFPTDDQEAWDVLGLDLQVTGAFPPW